MERRSGDRRTGEEEEQGKSWRQWRRDVGESALLSLQRSGVSIDPHTQPSIPSFQTVFDTTSWGAEESKKAAAEVETATDQRATQKPVWFPWKALGTAGWQEPHQRGGGTEWCPETDWPESPFLGAEAQGSHSWGVG